MLALGYQRQGLALSQQALLLLMLTQLSFPESSSSIIKDPSVVHSAGAPASFGGLASHGTTAVGGRLQVAACTSWTEWSSCSSPCGGTKVRFRISVSGGCGDGLGDMDQAPCSLQCEAGQQCGEWEEWSDCSATCGGGTRSRKRQADPVGGECTLLSEESVCNTQPCPDAECEDSDTQWTSWTSCDAPCGFRQLHRATDKPSSAAPQSCASLPHVWKEQCSPMFCESLGVDDSGTTPAPSPGGSEEGSGEEEKKERSGNMTAFIAGGVVGGVLLLGALGGGAYHYFGGRGGPPEAGMEFEGDSFEAEASVFERDLETLVQIEDFSISDDIQ